MLLYRFTEVPVDQLCCLHSLESIVFDCNEVTLSPKLLELE